MLKNIGIPGKKKKMVMSPKSNNTINTKQQLNVTKSVMQKVYWKVNKTQVYIINI